MQFQKEIDDLRSMHQKQLQKLATDADGGREQTMAVAKAEVDRVNTASEEQKNRLTKEFEGQIEAKEKNLDKIATNIRDTSQNETTDLKKKLTQAHTRELHDLMKQRVEENNEHQRMQDHLLESKDNQAQAIEQTKDRQATRMTQEFERNINNERETFRNLDEINRENMSAGVLSNRDKFDKATAQIRKDQVEDRQRMAEALGGAGSRARYLENQNQALKDQAVRDRTKSEATKATELKNLRDSMMANVDRLEDARKQTVEAANMRSKEQIDKMSQTSDQNLNRTNKYYLEKISGDEIRNQERFQSQAADSERMISKEKISGDSRATRLQNANDLEQSKMRNYFDRASAQMRDNFDIKLREMRANNQKDQDALFASFNKTAMQNDAKFQQSIADINAKYEKQLNDVQEMHGKELKDQQMQAERDKKEMAKRSDLDLQVTNSQWQNRVAKLQEQHAKEMDEVNRRHQEALANLGKTRQA
jgi:hypothetical protein